MLVCRFSGYKQAVLELLGCSSASMCSEQAHCDSCNWVSTSLSALHRTAGNMARHAGCTLAACAYHAVGMSLAAVRACV